MFNLNFRWLLFSWQPTYCVSCPHWSQHMMEQMELFRWDILRKWNIVSHEIIQDSISNDNCLKRESRMQPCPHPARACWGSRYSRRVLLAAQTGTRCRTARTPVHTHSDRRPPHSERTPPVAVALGVEDALIAHLHQHLHHLQHQEHQWQWVEDLLSHLHPRLIQTAHSLHNHSNNYLSTVTATTRGMHSLSLVTLNCWK